MNEPQNDYLDSNRKSNKTKHIVLRAGLLVITLLLMIIRSAYTGNGWWVLMSLILGFGLAIIWFLFILIETFILYSKKKADLAKINIIMLGVFIFSAVVIFFYLQ